MFNKKRIITIVDFRNSAINKNNLFSDVSNYVSYELGQPSHAYDFEKIVGEIKLKFLEDNIEFQTLLGKKINLQKGDLIFEDDNEVINLAGLMGSQGTSCPQETKKVLITSQNHGFMIDEKSLPSNIRLTHRSLFDDSLQGIELPDCYAYGFQGHPEASPGPHDIHHIFNKFINHFSI